MYVSRSLLTQMCKGTGGNTIEVQEYVGYVVRARIVRE